MNITHLQDGFMRLCKERMFQDTLWCQSHQIPECMTYEIFKEYRVHQLKQAIDHVYAHSTFYGKRFAEYGLTPSDFKEFKDLEKFPFTYPEDIRGNSYDFLCTSQRHVSKPVSFYSGGTTGIKKRMYYSEYDVQNIMKFLAIGMNCVAATDEICQVIMPNSQGRGIGGILAKALSRNGMKAYATDIFADSQEQINATIEHQATVWFGDTGTIYRITKESEQKYDLAALGIKIMFLTIGNISETMKRYLEKTWNCKVITHYGLTEVGWGLAVDCLEGKGYHYNELDVYVECVDEKTGLVVSDGLPGEIVFTSLGREAMPLIRYRSRDYASIMHGGCACGKECEIIGHVQKRIGAGFLTPNGIEIVPPMLEDAIYSCANLVDYRVCSEGNKLIVEAEFLKEYSDSFFEVQTAIGELDCIKNGDVSIEIKPLPSGALKQYCLEKKHIKAL